MAKKSKSALPKRIAGIKVPKALRKDGLGAFLATDQGRKLALDAVLALGAAAVATKESKPGSAVRQLLKGAGTKGEASADQIGAATAALSHALAEAARAFTTALHEGPPPEAQPAGGWTSSPEAVEVKASKKKTASLGGSPQPH